MLNWRFLAMLQIIHVKIFLSVLQKMGVCHLKHVHVIKAIFSTFASFDLIRLNLHLQTLFRHSVSNFRKVI